MADPLLDLLTAPADILFQQFVALEGLNSGVPTRTTATLTPTTLRNIEQTFLELQPQHTNHSAGFVPPVVHHTNHANTMNSGGGTVFVNTEAKQSWQPSAPSSPALSCSPAPAPAATTTRRNVGGRRPAKDDRITPEEAGRRCVRRERNKMAAARCRKRRLDHTNELVDETDGLESKKQALQSEIQQLQREKEELEFLLEAHRPCCRMHEQKRPPPRLVPRRPSSLAVAPNFKNDAGIPISTPSNGINFESLMAGGTGLTPIATCASQTRDAGSPEANGGGQKLVAL